MPASLLNPIFAELVSGAQIVILGVLLIGVTLVVRWSARPNTKKSRDPLRDVQDEFRQVESSYQGQLSRMEVRLHDFAREIEGRMQTRIAMLDQLVVDARHEIERLEGLLKRVPPDNSPPPPSPPRSEPERLETIPIPIAAATASPTNLETLPPHRIENELSREICALADAGLSHEQIAARSGQPLVRVRLVLRLHRPQRSAA